MPPPVKEESMKRDEDRAKSVFGNVQDEHTY